MSILTESTQLKPPHKSGVQTVLPDTNKLLVEDHPGQKVDERGVGGEDRSDDSAVEVLEGGDVEIVGEDRHETEEKTP